MPKENSTYVEQISKEPQFLNSIQRKDGEVTWQRAD